MMNDWLNANHGRYVVMSPKLYISQNSNTEKFVQFFLAPFAIPQLSGVSLYEKKTCVCSPQLLWAICLAIHISAQSMSCTVHTTQTTIDQRRGQTKLELLAFALYMASLYLPPASHPLPGGGGKGGGRGKRGQGACGTTHDETEVKVDMRINQRLRPWSRNRHWLAVNWHLSNQLDQQESLPSYSMSLPLRAVRKIIGISAYKADFVRGLFV